MLAVVNTRPRNIVGSITGSAVINSGRERLVGSPRWTRPRNVLPISPRVTPVRRVGCGRTVSTSMDYDDEEDMS
jgi:hypothetical protein